MLNSKKPMDAILRCKSFSKVQFGDPRVLNQASKYLRLRCMELNLTCHQRSLCHQEIGKIEVLNGAVSQLELQVYSNQVLLMSNQFRDRLTENLERKKPIARDSLTEYMNQKALKIENSTTTKYARSFREKAAQMNQSRRSSH